MSEGRLQLVYDQISSKYYNKIHRLTKPVRDFFKAPYFSYQKVYLDGRYCLMANRPDFLEHYLSKRFFAYDPFLISPHSYTEGQNIFIISDEFYHFDDLTKDTIIEIENKFGFYESILVLIKNFDSYEVFVFSSAIKGRAGLQHFLNHQDLLNKFINYFKTNMRDDLYEIYDIGVNIAEIRGDNFRTEVLVNQDNSDQKLEFLKEVSYEEYTLINNMKSLTPREEECLYWMVRGKTSGETADILNLSSRTVEGYREKCRFKLGDYYSYSNLIYKLGKYGILKS